MSGFEGKADFHGRRLCRRSRRGYGRISVAKRPAPALPILNGPIEMRDTKAVDKEINDFKSALGIRPRIPRLYRLVTAGTGRVQFSQPFLQVAPAVLEAAAAALAPDTWRS